MSITVKPNDKLRECKKVCALLPRRKKTENGFVFLLAALTIIGQRCLAEDIHLGLQALYCTDKAKNKQTPREQEASVQNQPITQLLFLTAPSWLHPISEQLTHTHLQDRLIHGTKPFPVCNIYTMRHKGNKMYFYFLSTGCLLPLDSMSMWKPLEIF